jgi:acrylyl-CoA reductase (NADPH)
VALTGCGAGERHWGGYAQLARVKADWIVPLPSSISLERAMGIGTAGFTAMQCVLALESRGFKPGGRDVVVTGAAGGVGSVAVAILSRLGYRVVASTGRAETHDYLRSLGAADFIGRPVLAAPSPRPMDSERWGGAVDTVGGDTLAGLLRTMAYGSSVAACGLAGGSALNTTVFPFILRGVSLLGVDSVQCPLETRRALWAKLAGEYRPRDIEALVGGELDLDGVQGGLDTILGGGARGRFLVRP